MHQPAVLAAQRTALEHVEELEADRARLFARAMDARAEVVDLWADERSGFAEMELAGTALVGQVRATRELEDGVRLRDVFPVLRRLLHDGVVFVPAAELLLRETRRCRPEVQAVIDARISTALIGRNTTDAARLVRSTILQVEAEIDADLTRQRQEEARRSARVWSTPDRDGTMAIGATMDALVGRRWVQDFEALVKAQQVLDTREGRTRTLEEIRVEVFGNLPSLVLELMRAARDGRLGELADLEEVDPAGAAELRDLVEQTRDYPLPDVEPARTPAADDPWQDLPSPAEALTDAHAPTQEPEPPDGLPHGQAAQDAAPGGTPHVPSPDALTLLGRCLRMPLPAPTVVNLHIPMATALGLSDAPGHLEGYGPLHGPRTRELLPSAALRDVYVDETTGQPVGYQHRPDAPSDDHLARRLRPVTLEESPEPRHDPSDRLAGFVRLRDVRCPGPGCTRPAHLCDLDHEHRYPEGPTASWNLGAKSRRCHGAKHHGWTVTRHEDGRADWTSPTGRTYTSHSPWQPPPKVERPFGVTFHLPPEDAVVEVAGH